MKTTNRTSTLAHPMNNRPPDLPSIVFWRRNVLFVAVIVIACAGSAIARGQDVRSGDSEPETVEPVPQKISPLEFQHLSCEQIAAEMNLTTRRVQETQELKAKSEVEAQNRAKTISILIFPGWPSSGPDAGVVAENSRLRDKHEALGTAAMQKGCDVPMAARLPKWAGLAHTKAREICKIAGFPALVSVTREVEIYQVTCDFASSLVLRCDKDACQKRTDTEQTTSTALAGGKAATSAPLVPPLRVAIFRVGFQPRTQAIYFDKIDDVTEHIEAFSNTSDLLELVYSFHSNQAIADTEDLWLSTIIPGRIHLAYTRNAPMMYTTLSVGEKIGADIVIMTLFELTDLRSDSPRIYSSDIYLFDVRHRQMYFRKGGGTVAEVENSVEELILGFLQFAGIPGVAR